MVGEEDCLYANIYTPSLPTEGAVDKLLSVMVYIHGGLIFNAGNGSKFGAKYLMDEDVVLVTFQFTFGSFGFISTGDNAIHGNMGAKDQIPKQAKQNLMTLHNWQKSKISIFHQARY